jgi:hypothetical protein
MSHDTMLPESMPEPEHSQESAGIVSHRDDFSEPAPVSDDPVPNVFGPRGPVSSFHAAPVSHPPLATPVHSVSVQRIEAMIPGLHGGIVIRAISLFEEPLELLVRDIRSVTHHPSIVERRLETVSLDEMAKKLFGCGREQPGLDPEHEQEWNLYVQNSVLPVIELLESGWPGAHAKDYNPVTRFFFGEGGILADGLERETILRKITARTGETRIPVVTKHDGPAMVIAYTV